MKKKFSLIFLCGIILLGVCGCGDNTDTKKNSSNETKENIEVKEDIDSNENETDTKDNNTNENDNINNKEQTKKEENKQNTANNNSNNNTNEDIDNEKDKNNTKNDNTNEDVNINEETKPTISNNTNNETAEPIQEEITITSSNLFKYFEIKREDIIPELNAFGERGTEEDFYYNLSLSLKNTYKQKLVSTNVSVEFASETYLRSFSYNRQTGIGTVTNDYRKLYNNSDKFSCNIKNESSCYITTCHIAGSEYINDKLIYYAYITEKLEPIRVGGSIILKK